MCIDVPSVRSSSPQPPSSDVPTLPRTSASAQMPSRKTTTTTTTTVERPSARHCNIPVNQSGNRQPYFGAPAASAPRWAIIAVMKSTTNCGPFGIAFAVTRKRRVLINPRTPSRRPCAVLPNTEPNEDKSRSCRIAHIARVVFVVVDRTRCG